MNKEQLEKLAEEAELDSEIAAAKLESAIEKNEEIPNAVPRAEFDALREEVKEATKRFARALNRIRAQAKPVQAAAANEPEELIAEPIKAIPESKVGGGGGGLLDTILSGMVRKTKR